MAVLGAIEASGPFEGLGWAIADLEGVRYPNRSKLYKDSGFQDYEPKVEATFQPKKT